MSRELPQRRGAAVATPLPPGTGTRPSSSKPAAHNGPFQCLELALVSPAGWG